MISQGMKQVDMRKFYFSMQVALLLAVSVSAVFYFRFTAEDAYITYRYAENWVNIGSLVFNPGEPINAMTSPLHAVLSAVFFFVTGNTVLSNKIVSLLLLFLSSLLVWQRYRRHVHLQLLALILLLSPCVLLWTFGGLETPILLFLATITVILVLPPAPFNSTSLFAIFFLTGLAFLTRYDSILFFAPICLYAVSKAGSIRSVVVAIAVAAILPLVWVFVSVNYYGDLLPTSFYVKTPKGGLGDLIFNGTYIASYLLFVGIIPVLALIGSILLPKQKTIQDVFQGHVRSVWWLYAGLVLELLYGLTMATHHMMFSFRLFVPYLPAAVILVVDLFRRASENTEMDPFAGRPAYLFAGFLVFLTLFQLYQNVYTYQRSVNGISLIGEYRALGIRDYASFIGILEEESLDIRNHWASINADSSRHPRIITYAAGMLPYTYRESYIYEKLVSYRHCHERYQQRLYADYLHILAPRQGEVAEQLPMPVDSYELVSSYEMFFDGSMQKFLVYYNPDPEEHNLSTGINDFCTLPPTTED
jgi:arabinofuranosyltransferase